MGLLRIFPIVILILQLYGARGEDLPQLTGNKLLEGSARELVPAKPLYKECSEKGTFPPQFVFKNSGTFKPSQVLNESIFKIIPFTSTVVPGALERVEARGNRREIVGGVGKFAFTKVEHKSGIFGMGTTLTVYALNVQAAGEYAYWLPQGGYVDVPRTPSDADPKYVFTTDFSGCSWTATPLKNGKLRLRHVNGDKEFTEFNNLPLDAIGGSQSYAMQFKNYGYIDLNNERYENAMGYAYMQYSAGAWSLYVQQKTCAPFTGQPTFKNGKLESVKMTYSNKDRYDMISGRKVYRIP